MVQQYPIQCLSYRLRSAARYADSVGRPRNILISCDSDSVEITQLVSDQTLREDPSMANTFQALENKGEIRSSLKKLKSQFCNGAEKKRGRTAIFTGMNNTRAGDILIFPLPKQGTGFLLEK